jgi:DNA-binding GntR family transcriptional regulator
MVRACGKTRELWQRNSHDDLHRTEISVEFNADSKKTSPFKSSAATLGGVTALRLPNRAYCQHKDRSVKAPPRTKTNGSRANGSNGLLKQAAYVELKARLTKGVYAPGTFLAERILAAELGMSKTPVKAALERLEQEGFIAVSPQQGIVVRELSFHDIADQYEIRVALEGFVLRTLAGKLTASQIEKLRQNLAAQEATAASSDLLIVVGLDTEFHQLPGEFLGNREICRVMRQLDDKMRRVISHVFQTHPNRAHDSLSEHREITEALIAGRGEEAAKLMELHLYRGRQLILSPNR